MNEVNIKKSIVVWLPTLNEELCVREMVTQIRNLGYDVYVTDAGSTDDTVSICDTIEVKVFSRPGKGKGFGLRQALNESHKLGYEKIVFIDCDMTYPVDAISEMVNFSNGFQQIIAARQFSKIVFLNRLANILLTGAINLLYGSSLSDTQSGLRLLDIQSFLKIAPAEGFDIEAEFTCYALKNKYLIKEISIDYFPRTGKSKSGVKDAFVILARIIRCRFS
jgi:glycosyltransferase involved in cell wall biosynthesis